jgi:hypothetical protein
MTESQHNGEDNRRPTLAGCLLMLLSVAVIFGSAVPIVTWRTPDTGQPLPRTVAIAAPLLLGALCYGIGTGILGVLGIRVLKEPEEDPVDPPDRDAGQEG